MKSFLPALLIAVLLVSCTTAYKSGQTPDDVYFSPARPQDEYVRTETRQEESRYRYEEDYRDDRYLRMKIRDRRYSGLYDDYYSYNPYYYHYYNSNLIYNSPWSSFGYWDHYYNPNCSRGNTVYHHGGTGYVRTPIYTKPRAFDLSVYNPQPSGNSSAKGARVYSTYNPSRSNSSSSNYRNSNRNAGDYIRDAFSGGSNNSSSTDKGSSSGSTNTGTRSSSSSSGSSSGSTNAPARRF